MQLIFSYDNKNGMENPRGQISITNRANLKMLLRNLVGSL